MKAIIKIGQLAFVSICIISLDQAFPLLGATATVLVANGGLVFTPAVTNIAVNDSVIWSWSASGHSSTSGTFSGGTKTPDGLWDSGTKNSGQTFTNKFTSAGTFPFYCSVANHAASGMTGAVIVATANLPPTVSITNPVSGTVLAAPANVIIQASATDDGTVTNVQFRIGATVLTNKATAPFFAMTNNLPAGSYTLSAIASDNLGTKATNTVSISVVMPLALTISNPQLTASSFQFNYAANIGLTYIVQRSTDLTVADWISIFTNQAASNPVIFMDDQATNSPGFYRVGRLPNP